jgi:hypothetical protein
VFAAFAWGFVAAGTLILGGAYALRWRVHDRVLGLVMAFGSGVLISSVAYELVGEAFDTRTTATAQSRAACSPARPSSSWATR